ncbi:hypothetical protein LEP1GSC060_0893 [Leptospira weilii serovar Ranarum str. ICFT]|uniref:Uncharacterized protein n=1 Tax=Leptospira weilii serovar Ranarum str. ICFT TaxID=1218598 RepID=N1WHM3_9LEPT|nr:hypothetical protein LEP1GSC060_0893 [Leptospira weilii serovar Ranarum str. ICFT]
MPLAFITLCEFGITNAKAIVVEIPKELERKARSSLGLAKAGFAQTFLSRTHVM